MVEHHIITTDDCTQEGQVQEDSLRHHLWGEIPQQLHTQRLLHGLALQVHLPKDPRLPEHDLEVWARMLDVEEGSQQILPSATPLPDRVPPGGDNLERTFLSLCGPGIWVEALWSSGAEGHRCCILMTWVGWNLL